MNITYKKDKQYYKFGLYGFLKNLRFFEPFLILFFREKNITFLQIGIIYAIREVLINVLEIPSGVIADIFGRKKSLMISFFFYIVAFVIFYISKSYYLFIIAIIFYALGDAFRSGTHKAMIFDYLKLNNWGAHRAEYYGHTRSWSQMGSAISSLLAAGVVFYTGNLSSVFLYSTIPYILDLLLISSYPNELDGTRNSANRIQIKEKAKSIITDYIRSFKNTSILKAIANLSMHSAFHRASKDYLQPIIQTFALSIPVLLYLSSNQRSAILIGIIYFIIYLLSSFASRKSGKLKEKVKTIELALNTTLIIGFIITFLSGLFYHYGFYFISIAFYVLLFVLENLRNPIGVAYVSELYDDHILATALSTNSQAKSLLAALLAPAIGFLADKYGIGFALSGLSLLILLTTPVYLAKKTNKN